MKCCGGRYWWFGAAICLLLVLLLTRASWLHAVARWLDISEYPRQSTDAVLVLGGGAETRPYVAAALIRKGIARKVLVPTNRLSRQNIENLTPPEHLLVLGVLRNRGLCEEAIELLPGPVDSTKDEAEILAAYLNAHPAETIAVVTHDYHTRRARMLFKSTLGDRARQVYFVPAPSDDFTQDNWWRTETGFIAYTSEILKLVMYAIRVDRLTQVLLALVLVGIVGRVVLNRRRNASDPSHGERPRNDHAVTQPPN